MGSVSEASMSPRSSLTTNVLPSRILTSALMTTSSRSRPRRVGDSPSDPGKSRCNAVSRTTLPSTPSAPRSTAAMAFILPATIASKVAMSALSTQSGSVPLCDTSTSPLRIRRYQCSVRSPSAMSKRTTPVRLSRSG